MPINVYNLIGFLRWLPIHIQVIRAAWPVNLSNIIRQLTEQPKRHCLELLPMEPRLPLHQWFYVIGLCHHLPIRPADNHPQKQLLALLCLDRRH